jgi:hypothetical protein
LRIGSGGEKIFTGNPEEDPTRSRPFAIETLIMSILFKPNRDEYNHLARVTDEMQRMFEGVTCQFDRVHRISQLHDRLDKDGAEDFVIDMKPPGNPVITFMDKVDYSWGLVLTSPSVGRIALATSAGIFLLGAAIVLLRGRMHQVSSSSFVKR